MDDAIKDAEVFDVTTIDENKELVSMSEEDALKDALMHKILGENVSVAVGNYIFIPPLANPEVSSPDRAIALMGQPNFCDGYVHTNIEVDGQPMTLVTHMSRIVHEGLPPSVSVMSVDKFSEEDLRTTFKNEFPRLFVDTIHLMAEHKKSIAYKG